MILKMNIIQSGTDILLNDRQNEFNNNNMSLCEKNCKYAEYNNDNKKAICRCGVKYEQLVISDLVNIHFKLYPF